MQSEYVTKPRKYLAAAFISIAALILTVIYSTAAFAATTPPLGNAASYGVLSSTYVNGSGATINGDVGFTVAPTTVPLGTHTNYGSNPPYSTAGQDQDTALTNLNSQSPCTTNWGGAVDLATDVTHGPVGVYGPGIYCSAGAMTASGPITLSGSGTYIFRAVGGLNTTAATLMTLANGASACDIFWTPTGATTLGASSTFYGTVIEDLADITIGANTVWTGRALAFDNAVTTGADSTITVPNCAPPTGGPGGTSGTTPGAPSTTDGSATSGGAGALIPGAPNTGLERAPSYVGLAVLGFVIVAASMYYATRRFVSFKFS